MAVLLLIEDDPRIRTALTRALTDRGHAVSSEPAGMRGLQRVLDDPPDLLVLDLGLPDVDGIQLLRMLRPVSKVPVIVATARDDDAATVAALNAGADDYVVKPFSAEQLDARIRAVLRRTAGEAPVDPARGGRAGRRPADTDRRARRGHAGPAAPGVRPARATWQPGPARW